MYIFSGGENSVYSLWAKKQKQRIKCLCLILYFAFFYCCHLNLMTLGAGRGNYYLQQQGASPAKRKI